jgi:hypothetical protein
MGVDFYSYSNVRTEPIPSRFRATKKSITNEKRKDILKDLLSMSRDERILSLTLMGAQLTSEGLIIPDELELPHEIQDEFYKTIGIEPDFLDVCWNTNTIYRSTPETKSGSASRSYSGYGDFYRDVNILNKLPLPYMPPSTDMAPENGFVNTEKCILCLQGLNMVRDHYVAPDWKPDAEKFGESTDHRFDDSLTDKKDNIHDDSWFFREFYSMMALGAESGFIIIA